MGILPTACGTPPQASRPVARRNAEDLRVSGREAGALLSGTEWATLQAICD